MSEFVLVVALVSSIVLIVTAFARKQWRKPVGSVFLIMGVCFILFGGLIGTQLCVADVGSGFECLGAGFAATIAIIIGGFFLLI